MINKVHLEDIATYVSGVDFQPKKINFIYGANGTGKSTLSKFLNNEIVSPRCSVTWDTSTKEDVVVYNRNFVEKNFQTDTKLKGIFTLGEDSIEVQKEVEEKRKLIDELEEAKQKSQNGIDKICGEQADLRTAIEQKCWNVQKMYGSEFADALVGFRNRMEKFCDKCIEHSRGLEKENIATIEELRVMYQAAFAKDATKDAIYRNLPVDDIELLDINPLLSTVIAGKSDTPIGTFIEYLNASDWVKNGVEYARKVPGKCPYCQQKLPLNIQQDIESYFDKKYEENKETLIIYEKSYVLMVEKVKDILQEIENQKYSYIDYGEFERIKSILVSKLEKNQQAIQYKIKSLSEIVKIDSINELGLELEKIIVQFNERIRKNNELVENQVQAKSECRRKLWDYLTLQCIDDVEKFLKEYDGREKGKQRIFEQKKQKDAAIKELKNEVELKEASLTSVKPTVDSINHLLKEFGFNGFKLDVNEEKTGTYKIVRPSGEDASKTLSEGEHNFISFLYFYYLCFGSQEKTGLEARKVLVIDDPISSMDSNVLFIVSTLVKNIIRHCKENEKGIKQVIVLTHNVYFYKEITFWGNKDALPSTQTRYYILRKIADESKIQEYIENPIKTSYELLWKELKSESIGTANALMNVMRRILEHYFMVIGGIDYERCINEIEGTDKIICKALVSFINDGSHSVFEDLIFASDDSDIENYKRVFRLVFDKLGHIDHYNMMMNKA